MTGARWDSSCSVCLPLSGFWAQCWTCESVSMIMVDSWNLFKVVMSQGLDLDGFCICVCTSRLGDSVFVLICPWPGVYRY